MGTIVLLEVGSGKECPYSFTKSEGRSLFEYVIEYRVGIGNFQNVLGKIENQFNLNLSPLTKIGGPEYDLEDFDMDEDLFKQAQKQNLESWQSPQDLINCVQSLLKVLDETSGMFSLLGVSNEYFTKGIFRQDIVDLSKMLKWAEDSGERRVRLAGT